MPESEPFVPVELPEAAIRREVLMGNAARSLTKQIEERARRLHLCINAHNGDGAYDALLDLIGWTTALARKVGVGVYIGPPDGEPPATPP